MKSCLFRWTEAELSGRRLLFGLFPDLGVRAGDIPYLLLLTENAVLALLQGAAYLSLLLTTIPTLFLHSWGTRDSNILVHTYKVISNKYLENNFTTSYVLRQQNKDGKCHIRHTLTHTYTSTKF